MFPAPYWVSYPEMVKLAGGVPVTVTPEDGTLPAHASPRSPSAVGSYTKAIILNSPNNPCGVMYPADFVAELVAFCEKKGLYLVMDDIYHRLVFDGQKAPIRLRVRRQRPVDELEADRRQRRLEAVRDDRLPHRLDDRATASSSR